MWRGLLNQAARWLHVRAIEQWPAEFTERAVAELVAGESTWLARIGGRAVATATVTRAAERFWGPQTATAGYVYRLAVTKDLAGTGLGATVLELGWFSCASARPAMAAPRLRTRERRRSPGTTRESVSATCATST